MELTSIAVLIDIKGHLCSRGPWLKNRMHERTAESAYIQSWRTLSVLHDTVPERVYESRSTIDISCIARPLYARTYALLMYHLFSQWYLYVLHGTVTSAGHGRHSRLFSRRTLDGVQRRGERVQQSPWCLPEDHTRVHGTSQLGHG